MKNILILLVTLLLFVSCDTKTYKICGKVNEKFRTGAGYKSRPEAHIVFYSDSLKRNLDVEVSFNTYVNIQVNDNVCFVLSDWDLKK